MIKLEILDGDINAISRKLYEEAFSEDSQQFVDYFYNVDAKMNKVFIVKKEDEVISMIHLHDFMFKYNNNLIPTFYIVAVATLKAYKKQGFFRKNIKEVFNWLNKNRIPFVFLMPASESIYTPFLFRTMVNIPVAKISAKKPLFNFENIVAEDKLLNILNLNLEVLEIFKDKNYIKRQILSLDVQDGGYVLVKRSEDDIALLRYISDGKKNSILDIKSLINVNDNDFYKDIAAQFAGYLNVDSVELEFNKINSNSDRFIKYMYRIINLKEFVGLLSSKSDTSLNIKVKVVDDYIEENNGNFHIFVKNSKYYINDCNDFDIELSIDKLLEFLIVDSDISNIPPIHEVI